MHGPLKLCINILVHKTHIQTSNLKRVASEYIVRIMAIGHGFPPTFNHNETIEVQKFS